MAQKPLFKNKKIPSNKASAAKRHKVAKTKKGACNEHMSPNNNSCEAQHDPAGSFKLAPKKGRLLAAYAENKVSFLI